MKYKLLGNSGLKVSELCLGTMGFGNTLWGSDYATSKQIFDDFAAAGGNFIDTANIYSDTASESFLGDFMHADRDFFVMATKYSLRDSPQNANPNAAGNSRKNLMRTVEQSLKRLKTEYIDLLYLHAWDALTPTDEVMRGLDDLVRQGKINYAGISDTPAWVVAQANTMAQILGWTKFVALQIEYSLLQRTPERDLLPMAAHYNMSIVPWAPLAGGALTGKYLSPDTAQGRLKPESARRNDHSMRIATEVVNIAKALNTDAASVALQWVMAQAKSSIPIVGITKTAQLTQNLKCIDVQLSAEHLQKLNEISMIDLGFPHDFLSQDVVKNVLYGGFYDKIVR